MCRKRLLMQSEEKYKIRFFHGINRTNDPIYSFVDIKPEEYSQIKSSLEFQLFLADVEEAYGKIVYNYRDYEKHNFSIVLNHTLKTIDSSLTQSIVNSIDRHISNIVTSTYIYTCLLRIDEKTNTRNTGNIRSLKEEFKKVVNDYHATNYHYTFVDALRHKLNHGRNLSKLTILGGNWSTYWVKSNHNENLMIQKKDKRFSLLDMKVSKEEAKKIIDNKKHYEAVETDIPDTFYLRKAIRIYVNLLSIAHSTIREKSTEYLKDSNDLILDCLSKINDSDDACIIKYVNNVEKEKMHLFSYLKKHRKVSSSP